MIQKFADIFAQEAAIGLLQKAMGEDRLPHALIFAGPAGVGKRTTADALTATLLCENAPTLPGSTALTAGRSTSGGGMLAPCGKCESCRLMAAGNHPDFHVVYRQLIRLQKEDSKARELSADVIRDYLIAPANLRASLNHGKVFVVEEAELMNAAAQNTLLKTLEEPPKDTYIILLTDQPGALLPTIRSRCQMIRFGSIGAEAIVSELARRGLKGEKGGEEAAFFAEGSLGNAIRWTEQGIIEKAGELRQQLQQLAAGKDGGDLADWLRKAADAYAEQQIKLDKLASKDQAMHDGLAIYLRLASLILRRLLSEQNDPEKVERLCQCIEDIAETELNLQANVNVSLALMNWSTGLERELLAR